MRADRRFGRVEIQSDPQGTPKPDDLSGRLPGSSGFGTPGNPPPPTGISAVTGDVLLGVLGQVATDFLGGVTRRAIDASTRRTVSITLPPSESWSESGRLTVRLCLAAKSSTATSCAAGRAVASASVNVRGTAAGGAGATPTESAPGQSLRFRTTAAVVRRIRSARVVRIDASFTGATTHRTVTAHRTFARR